MVAKNLIKSVSKTLTNEEIEQCKQFAKALFECDINLDRTNIIVIILLVIKNNKNINELTNEKRKVVHPDGERPGGSGSIDLGIASFRLLPSDCLSLHYSLRRESMMIVTGPSLTRATFISAPNLPLPTFLPSTFSNSLQYIS